MKSNKMNGLDFGKYGRTLISLTTQHTAQNSSTNPYITSLNQTKTHTNVVETKRTLYQIGTTVKNLTEPAITCSKLTIETLQKGVKHVQS